MPDPTPNIPQDLGQFPPAVIPSPQRELANPSEETPLQGTDADNRAVGAGEGSGNCGDMLGSGKIEIAGEA
jgi:hypothetical protein